MTTLRRTALSLGTACLALAFLTTACAKATVDSKVQEYKTVKDRLEALSAKMPQFQVAINTKLADFDKDMNEAKAKGGEEGIKALGALIDRMQKYENELNPAKQAPPAGGAPTAPAGGGKLGGGAAPPPGGTMAPPGGAVAPPPGGAMAPPGGAVAPPPGGSMAPPGGGKLGGVAPAPVPTPAPVPAPAPTGGSGFGGK